MSTADRRVTLVTGAGSGMGRALTERLAARGEAVVAIDLDDEKLAWAAGNDLIAPYAGDVTDEATNESAVALAAERFGGLDGAALNAGIDTVGMVDALPMDRFDRVLDVNLRGVVLGVRAVVPALRARGGGAIVLTSSMGGLVGQVGRSAYGVAKAGLVNLAQTVSLELGHERIRINAVCPGPIRDTGLSAGFEERNPAAYRHYANRTALKRYGTAEEVAAVMDFLLSPDASYVTGAAIAVDGGATAGQALDQPLGNQ
jgi:meso-butanediol dehydrogenase/(S,S)-butanediol dehydrogenase/diacetyl reductase